MDISQMLVTDTDKIKTTIDEINHICYMILQLMVLFVD